MDLTFTYLFLRTLEIDVMSDNSYYSCCVFSFKFLFEVSMGFLVDRDTNKLS